MKALGGSVGFRPWEPAPGATGSYLVPSEADASAEAP